MRHDQYLHIYVSLVSFTKIDPDPQTLNPLKKMCWNTLVWLGGVGTIPEWPANTFKTQRPRMSRAQCCGLQKRFSTRPRHRRHRLFDRPAIRNPRICRRNSIFVEAVSLAHDPIADECFPERSIVAQKVRFCPFTTPRLVAEDGTDDERSPEAVCKYSDFQHFE